MTFLLDATLREGAQSPDARLTRRRQLAILRGLGRVGIEEAEIGCASRDGDLRGLVTAARRVAPHLRLSVWCRGLPADLALGAASGADVVHASLPVSDLHLRQRLHRDAGWLYDQVGRAADAARRLGVRRLALGLEDATRAGVERIAAVCRRAREAGYERVRLADTVSACGPTGLAVLVAVARSAFAGPVGVHCHDDFGLATGNAVAALEAGANWADGCLLGGGERAGTARSEALAAWLTVHGGQRYRLEELSGLCRIAARSLGRRLDRHAPVVGSAIWSVVSGLHVDGLGKNPRTYEPFDPARVGATRRLLLGSQSGRGALRQACLRLGSPVDTPMLDRLLARLRTGAAVADTADLHRLMGEVSDGP